MISAAGLKAGIAFAFIGLNFFVYAYLGTREVVPPRALFADFPATTDHWSCPYFDTMDADVDEVLGVTDYLMCNFQSTSGSDSDSGAAVNVYVGYHESQVRKYDEDGDKVTSIHPPEHCLPGGGWSIIDSRIIPITSGGQHGEAKRFVIAQGEARQLVYFWYQSRGRIIAANHEVILYKFWDRATRGRSDGSLARFTVPIFRGNEEQAEATLQDLIETISPHFGPYLPH
jgi:EpsI family protein